MISTAGPREGEERETFCWRIEGEGKWEVREEVEGRLWLREVATKAMMMVGWMVGDSEDDGEREEKYVVC